MSSMRRVAPTAFAVLFAPSTLLAQDANYWTLQYGPVAELLGGAVVGGTRDLSATYYNPGALSLAKDPSFLASVESFQATRIKAQGDAPFLDFEDVDFRPAPSLFALAAPRSWTGSHTLAFSSLIRQDLDVRVDNKSVGGVARPVGTETLFDQNMTESWFGLTWAHRVGERVGLGLTQYVAYRGQRTRLDVSGSALAPSGEGGAVLLVDDFDYSNYRLVWKAGLALERDSLSLGLTVTSPSVNLFGSGQAAYMRSVVRADAGRGEPADDVRARHEEDLASRYETPLSVAAGVSLRRGQNTFHATAEWFDAVEPFDVLDTSVFAGDASSARLTKRLTQEANSVFNVGVGFQRQVGERFSYYGAFTTDFTFADQDDQGGHSISTWDIYHFAAGTSLQIREVKFTLGLAYARGSDPRNLDVVEVPESRPAVETRAVDVRFSRLKVLVGFDFGR